MENANIPDDMMENYELLRHLIRFDEFSQHMKSRLLSREFCTAKNLHNSMIDALDEYLQRVNTSQKCLCSPFVARYKILTNNPNNNLYNAIFAKQAKDEFIYEEYVAFHWLNQWPSIKFRISISFQRVTMIAYEACKVEVFLI